MPGDRGIGAVRRADELTRFRIVLRGWPASASSRVCPSMRTPARSGTSAIHRPSSWGLVRCGASSPDLRRLLCRRLTHAARDGRRLASTRWLAGFVNRARIDTNRPFQDVPARNEPGTLKRSPRGDVIRVAPSGGYVAAFIANAFQLLHQERAKTSPTKWLARFHVDVAIGPVVMEQDAPACCDPAFNLDDAVPLQLRSANIRGLVRRRFTKCRTNRTM